MGQKCKYSQRDWDAYAKGEAVAEANRPLKIPLGLGTSEQLAFREGYYTRCEDIKNRPVVDEIKKMVSPLAMRRLFRSLANPH